MAGPHDKVAGRRGRPPGSKNKRTLAMESLAQQGLTPGQQQAAMALLKQRAEQKRMEDEESLQAAMASGQKRRGRPPGSRNRPREDGMCMSLYNLLSLSVIGCAGDEESLHAWVPGRSGEEGLLAVGTGPEKMECYISSFIVKRGEQ